VSKGQEALKDIKNVTPDANVEVLELDLASFKSIEKASHEFTSKYDRLDLLINNAGLVCQAFRRKTLARYLTDL
jgi:NAD(P)-dependent dehydrogenase (short-subunit alcohol dehydrogenase family)